MRLIKAEGDHYTFRLGLREKALFFEVLKHFPSVPLSYHRLTRSDLSPGDRSDQALLEEALGAQRTEDGQRVQLLLGHARRFAVDGTGWRVVFTREELEWLLQVLNDVRVGSWLKLGCPDPDEGTTPKLTPETSKYVVLMDLAGHFESVVLEALDAGAA